MSLPPSSRPRTPVSFWILGLLLVVYVALCTGQRDNKWGADAWEHHRVLLALTQHLWRPGNPTYSSDLPSVRYSPYMVAWAAFSRTAHVDPYNALGAAAVLNTVLLVLGVWALLRAFGESASAAAVLLVMVCLYGGAPGYANSYALADLPWHQVNPSAWSFALTLMGWAVFRNLALGRGGWAHFIAILTLATLAMLDHPMTGAFGIMGLFLIALAGPETARRRMLLGALAVGVLVGMLCLAWPWYSFLAALKNKQDRDYWFNPGILFLSLTQWCAPALLCVLFTVPLRTRPLVRLCLAGGIASFAAGVGSLAIHSPVFARFPLPGMIYLHVAIGVLAHEAGIFRPSTWPARVRGLGLPLTQSAYPMLQVALTLLLFYCVVPQLIDIAILPHLGRVYLTKLLHHRDRQQHPRQTLGTLLAPIGEKDVVLSDPETSWLIPSVRGRVVSAIHYELFVPDQPRRRQDVERFFSSIGDRERAEILAQYGVRWIVLDRPQIGQRMYKALEQDSAVVTRSDEMVLMDAAKWAQTRGNSSTVTP